MAMTSILPETVRKAGRRLIYDAREGVISMPFDRVNDVKRLVVMAGLAIKYDSPLYVTFADLVALGFTTEPIVGDKYPDRRPLM